MINKKVLVNKFAKALYENRGVIFVGSGISKPSCGKDWLDLLMPMAGRLGITINEKDNLPLIAQYIVNEHCGNRGPLVREITSFFSQEFTLNAYHRALSLTNVTTLWTTNYDMLLEKSFKNFDIEVKVGEYAISRSVPRQRVELIKLHGCIKSPHGDFVITQEDYEDFFAKRQATAQRLKNDLLTKSFLFIGYSFRDPNIMNTLAEVRRLCQEATQEHFMILKRIREQDDLEEARRQKLWSFDLRRMGIYCVLIDDYYELEEVLNELALKSRGNTVYCTGSHKDTSQGEVARGIGKELAGIKDIVLLSGQSSGIGSETVSAFTEECINRKEDIHWRLRIFPNPYSANPDFSDKPDLIPELKQWRSRLLSSAQVVVLFDGGMGTKAELERAYELNCKIIPVPQEKSEFMNALLINPDVTGYLKSIDPVYFEKAQNYCVKAGDVVSCVKKALR